MTIRTAFLAALATLPLLAGGASAHGGWGGDRGYGYGYGNPQADYWREREARHAWFEARRAREWEWQRRQAWEAQRYAPPQPGYYQGGGHGGGWGPRW